MRKNQPNYFYLKLSDICADIAQVCFATLVIPFLVGKQNLSIIFSGGFLSIAFWFSSIWLSRNILRKKDKK